MGGAGAGRSSPPRPCCWFCGRPVPGPCRSGCPTTAARGRRRRRTSRRRGLRRSVRACPPPPSLTEGSPGPAALGGRRTEGAAAETVSPRSAADNRFSGRDSLIFLVDASKAMFEPDEEGVTPFDMTVQVRRLREPWGAAQTRQESPWEWPPGCRLAWSVGAASLRNPSSSGC